MTAPVVFFLSWTIHLVIAVHERGSAAVKHGFDFQPETQTVTS